MPFREVGKRLAQSGYSVLVDNSFYRAVAADLKPIYRAEMAEQALRAFRVRYPKHGVVADVGPETGSG